MRHLLRLLCGLIAYCSWTIGLAGDLSVSAGKMLNNVDHGERGLVGGIELAHSWGEHGARINYQRAGASSIAEDIAYSTVSATERHGRITYAVGVISQISYSTAGWWQGQHYPNDGQHFSKSCRWCGAVWTVDYRLTDHLSARLQYIAQNRLDPTYNGMSAEAVWKL